MTTEKQKRAERDILTWYLEKRELVATFFDGPEPPDFILECGDKRIGVEIVEYHDVARTAGGYTRREVEAAWGALRKRVASYRVEHPELDGLSIHLEFVGLGLPSTKERLGFIESVATFVEAERPNFSPNYKHLKIHADAPSVLRRYLSAIGVRETDFKGQWSWNGNLRWIGTSDSELRQVIEPKLLSHRALPHINTNHLVVAGWRGLSSQTIAARSSDELNGFDELNAALTSGPFDEVTLLCMRSFLWRRAEGWRALDD